MGALMLMWSVSVWISFQSSPAVTNRDHVIGLYRRGMDDVQAYYAASGTDAGSVP